MASQFFIFFYLTTFILTIVIILALLHISITIKRLLNSEPGVPTFITKNFGVNVSKLKELIADLLNFQNNFSRAFLLLAFTQFFIISAYLLDLPKGAIFIYVGLLALNAVLIIRAIRAYFSF
jgi:hypothetical protein